MSWFNGKVLSPVSRDRCLAIGLKLAAISAGLCVFLIVAFVADAAWPALTEIGPVRFVTDSHWRPTDSPPEYRVLPMLLGSLCVAGGAMLIAVPWALGVALCETYFAPPALQKLIVRVLELFNGLPSVVMGYWGLVVLVPLLARCGVPGPSWLAGSLILSLMILPTLAISTSAALRDVSQRYGGTTAALGLSRWTTIWSVCLPAARRAIAGGLVLGFTRAMGETMAVVMVCGNVVQTPRSLLDPVRTITANIALEMGYATEGHRASLFVTGLVLLVVVAATFALTSASCRSTRTTPSRLSQHRPL